MLIVVFSKNNIGIQIYDIILLFATGCGLDGRPACRQAGRRSILMKYIVYIIRSQRDRCFYTGFTNNLIRRLSEHNTGKYYTPSTLHRGPFDLVYSEECESRQLARSREIYWKSGEGREMRDKLLNHAV